ncbi:hypothetical protein DFH07DRAFT_467999 [Mycena maculata]|uniref:MYND-type domain-containing protein n=1 Tax=Mycena maculata TaxID=230809 RepID=A0AAD7KAB9_9AGAR|nr:hypothetical protein DFH07DRAFT_467999 [Mycena maculata]
MHVVYPKDTVEAVSDFTRAADVADDGVADVKPQVRMQMLQRKEFHAFWTAVTRFLSVVREDQQEIRFLFDFAQCVKCFEVTPANPHLVEFHRIATVLYPGLKKRHEQFVFICIHKMVSALNDCLAQANSVKAARSSQNSRWPRSTTDILPYGGKIATQAFVRWAHYTEDMAFTAFGILGHMVKICGTLIIGDMTANADIGEAFVSTGFRMCRDGTTAICGLHDDCSDQLAAAAEFRQRATFAAGFLEAATTLAPEIFAVLVATRELKMVQLLSLILEVCDAYSVAFDPELDAQFKSADWTIFSTRALRILSDHPELHSKLGKLHRSIVAGQRAIEDPLHTAYSVLAAAKSRTCCHAPGYPHSLATTGREFKRCAACRVAAYCSKASQARAWKSGRYAHKQICSHIVSLLATGGELGDAFVRNCRAAEVSAEDALLVTKWEFNPSVAASDAGRRANAEVFAELNEVFWQLHPDQHPQAAERFERISKYWAGDLS